MLAVAMIVAAATGGGAPAYSLPPPRRIALLIGNDTFADSSWPELGFAVQDAEDLGHALADSFDSVVTVGRAGPVTKATVLRALTALVDAQSSPDDTIVVYISTHGTLARGEGGQMERVLVFSDTEAAHPLATGLRYSELLEQLDRLRSNRQLLILASCYAGAGKSRLDPELARELRSLKGGFFTAPPLPQGEGRIVLAASAWGEPAREDAALKNDVYTHFFIEALRGFDRNHDGAVTALEAHDYARERTTTHTRNAQHPTLTAEIVGQDPIVLTGRVLRLGDPVIAAYGAAFSGARLEVDGQEKGTLPGGFVVTSGDHHVRVLLPEATTALIDEQIAVQADVPVLLDTLLTSARPSYELTAIATWQWLRDSQITQGYVSDYLVAGVGASRRDDTGRWRVGAQLSATHTEQSVTVAMPNGRYPAHQTLTVADVAVQLAYNVSPIDAVDAWLHVDEGAVLGWRSAEFRMKDPDQRFVWPRTAIGLSLSVWPWAHAGFSCTAEADLLLASVEGRRRAVFADRYSVGVVLR